ncbi:hypothetical protein HYPSUDRAFT_32889 [Hypholoma sublateritium FD-334 SS-4]|uniref:Uncharacterized protein n=1 Tax=Hypholoma sublateritium (strain FD-334 SS-4) TaxID=945553 RepID=A0A0D2QCR8_HYPSF|nr:hypothetical protein HYPSUDRAFT_32889 [Hypholoma sublateritium FD-334 SS-4]
MTVCSCCAPCLPAYLLGHIGYLHDHDTLGLAIQDQDPITPCSHDVAHPPIPPVHPPHPLAAHADPSAAQRAPTP